jgi:hypothetical protein
MENFPKAKKRGRPRKLPEPMHVGLPPLPEEVRALAGFDVPTERTSANRFYADRARGALRELSKTVRIPDDPVLSARIRVGIEWLLGRTTVLSELGRMMVAEPQARDIARFHSVVHYIAERRPKITAREAAAYVRRMRLGETHKRRDRLEALHHDLNAAINYHRRRFPESSWADVLKALELTEGQIRKKIQ